MSSKPDVSLASVLRGQRVLVACSGGIDSVVLLDVLAKLARRFDFSVAVFHAHHGPESGSGQSAARSDARAFVRTLASKYGVPFFERESLEVLRGEEALRNFRKRAIEESLAENNLSLVALGHHRDDLLETRLMRLIRGTGPRGLRAMSASTKKLVRPFLSRSRADIQAYAAEQKLSWIEDPSNTDQAYFRNWIRGEWLPTLEKKRPGSRAALARSLDLLSEAVPKIAKASPLQDRRKFHELTAPKKRALIAAIATDRGARDFGVSKIIEVLKRLDRLEVSGQRSAKFVVGGVQWSVTSDHIRASADARRA